MDTLQIAVKEAESWMLAQRVEVEPEREAMEQQRTETRATQTTRSTRWRCQTDASWINEKDMARLGFILLDDGTPVLFGAQGRRHDVSALHAEAEGLMWAMQEVLKHGNREIRFETDCNQLIKLIEEDEDWPSMAPEIDEIKALSTNSLSSLQHTSQEG